MSLFKRKQSKEKDTPLVDPNAGTTSKNSPPVLNPPAMISGANGMPTRSSSAAFGQSGGAPVINGNNNGRRMTSGPNPPGPGPNGVHPQYNQPNGNNIVGYDHPGASYSHGPPGGPASSGPSAPGGPGYQPTQQINGGMPQTAPGTRPPGGAPPGPPTSYPWSTRPLRLFPPSDGPPGSAPISPFPRYGLSVPAFPSHSGHMLIFGGLIGDDVQNDMWSIDIRDNATMLVKTKGDAPLERVGHVSAIADRIMIVWGGDTKKRPEDRQDEGLYILDLRTQEWTSVPVQPGPVGRYGHAATMMDTRFFVFGGQADGQFMNDLWCYDIRQLSGDRHIWEPIKYSTDAPPRRTGHVLVSYQGKLILFGGTDGNFHYNDTWTYDTATGVWTELSCIGYIPVPREGHAAAIVDDVVYVFGGRDVNGKDLGDLAAFRITNQRWYMFQNMGPAPTARSGHALVAAHGKVFVLGGEPNGSNGPSRDDPSIVHVLDTTKIKYPPDSKPPVQAHQTNQVKTIGEKGSSMTSVVASPPRPAHPSDTPQSLKRQMAGSASMDSLARATSPMGGSSDRLHTLSQPPNLPLAAPLEAKILPRGESLPEQHHARAPPTANGHGGPPQRPRREGDEQFRRAMSPTGPASPVSVTQSRVTSPPNGPASPPTNHKNGFSNGVNVRGARSPSPRLRQAEGSDRPAPPPDAFYYGKSPTANGFAHRPPSVGSTADLLRELKSKETELEAGKKREVAMRVILARAIQEGFVVDDDDVSEKVKELSADQVVIRKLTDALVRMKQEKAAIQNDLVLQMRSASEKAMDADRLRRGALQEAAFYRAKAATLESNSLVDLNRIEKERINELEKQLGTLATENTNLTKELERINETSVSEKDINGVSAEREAEAVKRAEEAEEAHRLAMDELEELRIMSSTAESSLREHTEKLITMSSTAQQREAERDQYRSQLEDAVAARDEHVGLIEQAQGAIAAAGVRHAELEGLHSKATSRIKELEEELAETRNEIEARGREVEAAHARVADIEIAYTKSREEADSLRTVTTSRLGELLDSHKELRADESRAVRGHQEQLRALEEESKSLRKMLREAGQRLEDAEAGVAQHRQKHRDLEISHLALKSEMRAQRTKLYTTQSELAKYRELHSNKDQELRERDLAVTEIETRCTVLRNLLADHGVAVSDHELDNVETPSDRELEAKLRDRERVNESAQREIEELTLRCQEAESKVESLGRLVDRMKDARSPTSMSMRSPSPTGETEKKMQETESHYKEKLAALEADYQTAVRYVKGTEKMLNRMKGELSKQKTTNTALQTEIDRIRGRPSEAGARTRDASGRSTPNGIDGELSRRFNTLQTQHTALQAELAANRDVLAAREREVDLLRRRVEEAEREVDNLREDLLQAQHRITTLLEMNQPGFHMGSEDGNETVDEGDRKRRDSTESSEEASMAFDKFTKELKQWERTRSPDHPISDDDTVQYGKQHGGAPVHHNNKAMGHRRNSSEYSGDWVQ